MTKRMLIDASHPEETRVVVLSGNRVDEFDYEAKDKRPLKGNIYLAKVTRVEPSLQAAFVDYGGNRNGFLPFSEIHPDYYRLPVADREALIAEEQAAQQREDDDDTDGDGADTEEPDAESEAAAAGAKRRGQANGEGAEDPEVEQLETGNSVETISGDDIEDAARRRAAFLGRYKIQEVIKRRQVILVQVVKEERGNKGAALTTYLSLAGRYCVLMPNTNKGGGISRKIANTKDRRRLKGVLSELNIPEGIAVIVRTAGSNRTKAEIKRDYEYLLRLWDQIRETTLESTAPCLIHEEANLIKRSIRDLYTRDMDEVLVEGEDGYKLAKSFMRSLMPSHAKKVQRYQDAKVPLFHRHQVEAQLDNIHNPSVQLKSGGYVVMNQTEALVAIDVNSGKATKERHIEETALKTNLEAADEIARQLKLRDLAGLIVIDFIDMDAPKNNKEVEQRLKEAMKQDRARIQLGRISPFGLLELSRQRLRPSLHETSTEVCQTCGGSGFVRSPDSTALHVLRALEEEGVRRGGGEMVLTVPTGVALYTLNEKRARLQEIEARYNFQVKINTDDHLIPPAYRLDRLTTVPIEETGAEEEAEAEFEVEEAAAEAQPEAGGKDDGGAKKRSRRGGRKRKKDVEASQTAEEAEAEAVEEADEEAQPVAAEPGEEQAASAGEDEDEKAKSRRRRRGKRGGRRRSKRREGEEDEAEAIEAEAGEVEAGEAEHEPEQAGAPADRATETEAASAAEAAGQGAGAAAVAEHEAAPEQAETKSSRPASRRKSKPDETEADAEAGTADAGNGAAETEAAAESETAETEDKPRSILAEAAADSTGAGRSRGRSSRSRATTSTTGRARRTSSTSRSRKTKAADEEPATEATAESTVESTVEAEAPTASTEAADGGAQAEPAADLSDDGAGSEAAPAEEVSEAETPKAPPAEVAADRAAEIAAEAEPEPGAEAAGEQRPSAEPSAEEAGPVTAEAAAEQPAEPEPSTVRTHANGAVSGETADEEAAPAAEDRAAEAPYGEAAEPEGHDDLAERSAEDKPKRRGWWQKLLQ